MTGQAKTLDRYATTGDLDKYDLSSAPCNLLKRALRRAGELVVEELGDEGLRPRQFTALIAIYQNPGITQNDLVMMTGSDRSTIAEMISRLDSRGDVTRERDSMDQRVNRIYITETGTKALQQSLHGTVRAEERFRELVDAELRGSFFESLRELGDDD